MHDKVFSKNGTMGGGFNRLPIQIYIKATVEEIILPMKVGFCLSGDQSFPRVGCFCGDTGTKQIFQISAQINDEASRIS